MYCRKKLYNNNNNNNSKNTFHAGRQTIRSVRRTCRRKIWQYKKLRRIYNLFLDILEVRINNYFSKILYYKNKISLVFSFKNNLQLLVKNWVILKKDGEVLCSHNNFKQPKKKQIGKAKNIWSIRLWNLLEISTAFSNMHHASRCAKIFGAHSFDIFFSLP